MPKKNQDHLSNKEKEETLKHLQETFAARIDPDVVYVILSERDYDFESAFEALLTIATENPKRPTGESPQKENEEKIENKSKNAETSYEQQPNGSEVYKEASISLYKSNEDLYFDDSAIERKNIEVNLASTVSKETSVHSCQSKHEEILSPQSDSNSIEADASDSIDFECNFSRESPDDPFTSHRASSEQDDRFSSADLEQMPCPANRPFYYFPFVSARSSVSNTLFKLPLQPNSNSYFQLMAHQRNSEPRLIQFRKPPKHSQVEKVIQNIHQGGKHLVILRGLPGSGKSTLASRLCNQSGVICSTDYFFTQRSKYIFDPSKLSEAHEWNQQRARKFMEEGKSPIVIDNTNIESWEIRPYVLIGERHSYKIEILEPETSWKFNINELVVRNVHGITKEKIMAMYERYERNVTVSSVLANTLERRKISQVVDECVPQAKDNNMPRLLQVRSAQQTNSARSDDSEAPVKTKREVKSLNNVTRKIGSTLQRLRNIPDLTASSSDSISTEMSLKKELKIYNLNSDKRVIRSDSSDSMRSAGSSSPTKSLRFQKKSQVCIPNIKNLQSCNDFNLSPKKKGNLTDEFGRESSGNESIRSCPASPNTQPSTCTVDDSSAAIEKTDNLKEILNEIFSTPSCVNIDPLPVKKPKKIHRPETSPMKRENSPHKQKTPSPPGARKEKKITHNDLTKPRKKTLIIYLPQPGMKPNLKNDPQRTALDLIKDDYNNEDEEFWNSADESSSDNNTTAEKSSLGGSPTVEKSSSSRMPPAEESSPRTSPTPTSSTSTPHESSLVGSSTTTLSVAILKEKKQESRNSPQRSRGRTRHAKGDLKTMEDIAQANRIVHDISITSANQIEWCAATRDADKKDKKTSPIRMKTGARLCLPFKQYSNRWFLSDFPLGRKELAQPRLVQSESGVQVTEKDIESGGSVYMNARSRDICENMTQTVVANRNSIDSLDKTTSTHDMESEMAWASGRFDVLRDMFPDVPRRDLWDLFKKCRGNIEWASNLLLDSNHEYPRVTTAEVCRKSSDLNTAIDVAIDDALGLASKKGKVRSSSSEVFFDGIVPPPIMNIEAENYQKDDHLSAKSHVVYNAEKVSRSGCKIEKNEALHCRPEERDLDIEGFEEEGMLFRLEPNFAAQLEELFGPPSFASATSGENLEIKLDFNLAYQIHKCWARTMQKKLYDEDCRFVQELQQSETQEMQEEKPKRCFSLDRKRSRSCDMASSSKSFNKMEKTDSVPNLNDIMDMEMALQISRDEASKQVESRWDGVNMATKLKRQLLYDKYPFMERTMLDEVFAANEFSLSQTEEQIRVAFGDVYPQQIYEVHASQSEGHRSGVVTKVSSPSEAFVNLDDNVSSNPEGELQDFRTESVLYHKLRQECFIKAQEAYRSGKRGAASFYAQQGHTYTQKIWEANRHASINILLHRNLGRDKNTIDLHLLFVREALEMLQIFLKFKLDELRRGNDRKVTLRIITGRGRHSVDQVPRLKKAVINYLANKTITYHEIQAGLIEVVLTRKDKIGF